MTNSTQLAADQSYLADLRRRFQADYSPQTAAEQVLLNEMIAAAQRLHHLNRLEEAHLQGEPDLATLGQLSRQRAAASSIFHRSLRMLDKAKAHRLSTLQNEANPATPPVRTNEANPVSGPNEPNSTPIPCSIQRLSGEFITTSEKVMNVEPPSDPLASLIESYRAAHPDDPEAAYRCQKALAHLHKFRPLGSPAQLRRELIAILHPPPE